MEYYPKAYFVYNDTSKELIDFVKNNRFATKIEAIHIDAFLEQIDSIYKEIEHVVVSIDESKIPEFLATAYRYHFSLGILPLPSQKEQIKHIYGSTNIEINLQTALKNDAKAIDLVMVDGQLVYSQATIGDIPLIGKKLKKTRSSFLRSTLYAIKKFFSIELQKFEITTENGKHVTTAGSGIVILNHTSSSLLSKIFNIKQTMRDGQITLIIISPVSIFSYMKLLSSFIMPKKEQNSLPESVGYMKSKSFEIKASHSKRVAFESGTSIALPVKFSIVPDAIKLNASEEFWKNNEKISSSKETIKITNLPDKNEAQEYVAKKHIPFFRSASEERFRELFQVLRSDAKLNHTFLSLMILSTILATLGLFANSAAVIIGAMLVAPLMTPIVSVSMGLLRGDTNIIRDSLIKIGVGVVLALCASSLLAFLLPYSEISSEMRMRINPTLLDLGVAILSGIIAAYSKSFKEIIQNLAGVAIAVALVPPLAVSGIGIGYGNFALFSGAFLLFFTNLVGIILAAVMTFNILGFSNVVKSKKSVVFVFALLLAVSYPLYLSYDKMLQKYEIATALKHHRFIVNDKYIIVKDVKVEFFGSVKVFNLTILVRESLKRDDLETLKADIERLFDTELFIKTEVEYIL
jgi:uncharacterized hydrophobic protein (TIGR00271 family)